MGKGDYVMKKFCSNLMVGILTVILLLTTSSVSYAAELEDTFEETAEYLLDVVKDPQVGSVGGDWAVIGLARSEVEVDPEYYQTYYETVEKHVIACKGVLHKKKYTDYSRLVVSLTAIGKDPRDVGGYNLLVPLGDFEKTIWQGINGPIWALIALDSGSYEMEENTEANIQATRDLYVQEILSRQLADGGFSLYAEGGSLEPADPDITGMALMALAKYRDQEQVETVIQEALDCMSLKQDDEGGFASWGTSNSESVCQMIVALQELGIALDDPRFVKNGYTMEDNLLSFKAEDGGFMHTKDESSANQMATEQSFYALVSCMRAKKGMNSLYRMGDAASFRETEKEEIGGSISGMHPDVRSLPVVEADRDFTDIEGHSNAEAIRALAMRDIINGRTKDYFKPDDNISRAEFAAIVVKGLGLIPEQRGIFEDVAVDAWYAPYVDTAYSYGIVKGTSETLFMPANNVTRQEAATMIANAAELTGIKSEMSDMSIRDMLAQFGDYVQISPWAQEPTAFCYSQNILDQWDLEVRPKEAATRAEIAQMLFNLLNESFLFGE